MKQREPRASSRPFYHVAKGLSFSGWSALSLNSIWIQSYKSLLLGDKSLRKIGNSVSNQQIFLTQQSFVQEVRMTLRDIIYVMRSVKAVKFCKSDKYPQSV